jgi:hypothetical protein
VEPPERIERDRAYGNAVNDFPETVTGPAPSPVIILKPNSLVVNQTPFPIARMAPLSPP